MNLKIKAISIITILSISLWSCSKESKAIRTVKNMSILDCEEYQSPWTRLLSDEEIASYKDSLTIELNVVKALGKKNTWKAQHVKGETYLVCYVNNNGHGRYYELDMKTNTLHDASMNPYLSYKYGLINPSLYEDSGIWQRKENGLEAQFYKSRTFQVDDMKRTATFNRQTKKITYKIEGSLTNNSGENISGVDLRNTSISVIYQAKKVEMPLKAVRGALHKVSKSNPWKNNTKIDFELEIPVDAMYINYPPEGVLLLIQLEAENIVGYNYNKVIYQEDISESWANLVAKYNKKPHRSR